jgi:hemoglobin
MQQNISDLTLYQQLGQEAGIAQVVDLFYTRVVSDPQLAGYFVGLQMNRLKSHQVAFLSQVTGGPRQYSGQQLSAVHQKLQISQADFDRVVMHLLTSLSDCGVSDQIQSEVVEALAPLSHYVVNWNAAGA